MSEIWDSLKGVEQATGESSQRDAKQKPDRRSGPRFWAHLPVFVYGRGAGNEPFHEATEIIRANPTGGLITLTVWVALGRPILLINRANQKEQPCRIVGHRGTYLERSAFGFEFLEPTAGFWDPPLSEFS